MHWHLVEHKANEALRIEPHPYKTQGEAEYTAKNREYIIPITRYYVAACKQTCSEWHHMTDTPLNTTDQLRKKLEDVREQLELALETVTL